MCLSQARCFDELFMHCIVCVLERYVIQQYFILCNINIALVDTVNNVRTRNEMYDVSILFKNSFEKRHIFFLHTQSQ